MKFKKCFIDADSIIYKIAYKSSSVREAKKSYEKAIEDIQWDTNSDEVVVALRGKGNFRYDIAGDYKGHRAKKPALIDEALVKRRKAIDKHAYSLGHFKSDNCEADDVVSIWADEEPDKDSFVIAHIDKDIDMVTGWHYNFGKRTPVYYIDDDEGWLKLCTQMLTGDSTDNIKGIKGVGPKTAEKLLADAHTSEEMLAVVTKAWKEATDTEDWEYDMETCFNLVYMRRNWDDFRRLTIDEVFNVTEKDMEETDEDISGA